MQNPELQFVPQDILAQLVNMRPFIILVLSKGPNYNSADTQKIIQSEHLPNLFALRQQGVVQLSIPIMDQSDIAAIAVYDAMDKGQVEQLVQQDPAVSKGVFTYQLLSGMGMKGDTLK